MSFFIIILFDCKRFSKTIKNKKNKTKKKHVGVPLGFGTELCMNFSNSSCPFSVFLGVWDHASSCQTLQLGKGLRTTQYHTSSQTQHSSPPLSSSQRLDSSLLPVPLPQNLFSTFQPLLLAQHLLWCLSGAFGQFESQCAGCTAPAPLPRPGLAGSKHSWGHLHYRHVL